MSPYETVSGFVCFKHCNWTTSNLWGQKFVNIIKIRSGKFNLNNFKSYNMKTKYFMKYNFFTQD